MTAESTASTANVTGGGPAGTGTAPGRGPRGRGPRGRRSLRAAAVALGLAGALALTACSDDGGSGDDGSGGGSSDSSGSSGSNGGDTSSSADPGASAGTDAGGGTGGSPSAGDGLEGSWLATTGGQAVALIVTGDKAGLFATGGTVCSGIAAGDPGARTIRLKCTDGSDDRATGKVASVDGTSLTVTWEGGLGEETFTRSEGGSMPPGLPTEGLGG
ncbi:hypothetical protein [Streptomyces olivaceus]|uniref:hypothetical protein n=1 Tax=Streptomyces olivaceus TaxID=47716 RepID=UPI003F4B5F89